MADKNKLIVAGALLTVAVVLALRHLEQIVKQATKPSFDPAALAGLIVSGISSAISSQTPAAPGDFTITGPTNAATQHVQIDIAAAAAAGVTDLVPQLAGKQIAVMGGLIHVDDPAVIKLFDGDAPILGGAMAMPTQGSIGFFQTADQANPHMLCTTGKPLRIQSDTATQISGYLKVLYLPL